MNVVYEVVDATDDETYFSQGVYSTREQALAALDVAEPPSEYNYDSDVITFEVRCRPLDAYSERGRAAAVVTWTRQPVEDDDYEDRWQRSVEISAVCRIEALAGEGAE